jgi:hypothetical protein
MTKKHKRAEREQAQHLLATRQTSSLPPLGQSLRPSAWPVLECLVSATWQTPGELAQVLVARESPEGAVAASSFLVDLCCLGVKDAFTQRFESLAAYQYELRERTLAMQPMTPISLDLAAKIVREGLAYARSLGFRPHRDYQSAAPLLDGANPDAAPEEVPLGKDGRPYFISGPHDNVPKIMETLDRAVGPGNYHFMHGLLGGADSPVLLTDEGLIVDTGPDAAELPPPRRRGLFGRLAPRNHA